MQHVAGPYIERLNKEVVSRVEKDGSLLAAGHEDEFHLMITNLALIHSFMYQMAFSGGGVWVNRDGPVIEPRPLTITQAEMDFLDEFYTSRSAPADAAAAEIELLAQE